MRGIHESLFQGWQQHPCSKLLQQFARDYAGKLVEVHLDEFRAGPTDPLRDAEARGHLRALEAIADITHEEIVQFYARPTGDAQTEESEE